MFDSLPSLSPLLGVSLLLLLGAGWYVLRLRGRVGQFERDLMGLREAATQATRAEAQEASVGRLLTDLTRLTERLQNTRNARDIPEVLVGLAQRTFDADQVLVLFTRRNLDHPEGRPVLVVGACSSGAVERSRNEIIQFGEGELGLVAEIQLPMDRKDLDAAKALRHATVPGLRSFRTDLAAPMIVGGETFGVVALSGLGRRAKNEKTMLTLMAQTAGFGLKSAVSHSAVKTKAELDGLTRILNKNAVTQRIGELVSEAERAAGSVGIVLLDVDHFKHYNDSHGHAAGDGLLQELAALVNRSLRPEDVFGRFGGEEFVIVTPLQGVASTYGLAERLRRAIEAHGFEHGASQPLGCVSVSGGVASFPTHGRDSTELLASATAALYRAKHAGRNRIEISAPLVAPST